MNCATSFGDISPSSARYNTNAYITNTCVACICLAKDGDISPKHVGQFMYMNEI